MLFEKIGIIDENFKFRPDMYVGVLGNRIEYVGEKAPSEERRKKFGEVYDRKNIVLMPGFYNAHGHSPMSLMRGYGENLPLDRWLNERIFPFEAKLYAKGVYWGTLLTMAESIRYGIVSTTDMYYFTDDMVKAISVSGEKNNISRSVTNVMKEDPKDLQALKEMRDAIVMYHGFENGRVLVDASLHAEYTNDDRTARAVAECAREFDVNMHVHVAETESETQGCKERHYGKTPVEYLESMGIFDQPTTAAHCVWLTDDDREILKAKNVTVASNPISNLKLVSGICDVPKLYDKGINVAIGTDSVSSNNSLNFFEELKTFALLGKIKSGDPARMSPSEVLRSATRAGAVAQERRDCGLIKEGFKADMIAVDLDVPNMQPIHDVLSNLVFSASGTDVCMTMVDGKVLYKDGDYTTIDIEQTVAEANNAKDKILKEL